MKSSRWHATLLYLLVIPFVMGLVCSATAVAAGFDITVRIDRLEETLNLIDELAAETGLGAGMPGGGPPTTMLRAMLQGTDWIDPRRRVAVGIGLPQGLQGMPKMVGLIPFRKENKGFQTAFGAQAGPDYYILPLPPGAPVALTDEERSALVAATTAKAPAVLTVKVAAQKILAQLQPQIDMLLQQLEQNVPAEELKQSGLEPADLTNMIKSMQEKLTQLETLSLGLDLNRSDVGFVFEGKALPGTELDQLFQKSDRPAKLGAFTSSLPIRYKIGAYDVERFMNLFQDTFGPFYAKMGVDFSQITEVMRYFTGEMAGGISFADNKFAMELISTLKEDQTPADFLERVYIPWMLKYSLNMTKMMEAQLGTSMEPMFAQTPDSSVAGQKVVGIQGKLPIVPPQAAAGGKQKGKSPAPFANMDYEMRMTMVDNMVLIAPDDRQLAGLIETVRTLEPQKVQGPLFHMEFDLDAYMDLLAQITQQSLQLPPLGRITMAGDFDKGQFSTATRIPLADIQNLIAFSKNNQVGTLMPKTGSQPETEQKQAEAGSEPEVLQDAAYWIDRGTLVATYGNDKAAVRYYQKALEQEPQNSEALFQMGVSFGELGRYDQAIASLNQALALVPDQGDYYYGRGRVYLLDGQKEKALADMQKAAELGNADAESYLRQQQSN